MFFRSTFFSHWQAKCLSVYEFYILLMVFGIVIDKQNACQWLKIYEFYIRLMVFGIVIDKQNACQWINFYRLCDIFSLIDKQNACQPNIKMLVSNDWQAKSLSVRLLFFLVYFFHKLWQAKCLSVYEFYIVWFYLNL